MLDLAWELSLSSNLKIINSIALIVDFFNPSPFTVYPLAASTIGELKRNIYFMQLAQLLSFACFHGFDSLRDFCFSNNVCISYFFDPVSILKGLLVRKVIQLFQNKLGDYGEIPANCFCKVIYLALKTAVLVVHTSATYLCSIWISLCSQPHC